MTLTKYSPQLPTIDRLTSWFLNDLFPDFPPIFTNGLEDLFYKSNDIKIKSTDNEYLLSAPLTGFKKEEVKVEIVDGIISIKAEHSDKNREWQSRSQYQNSFTLPDNVDVNKITGELENGILLVKIPKQAEQKKLGKVVEIK